MPAPCHFLRGLGVFLFLLTLARPEASAHFPERLNVPRLSAGKVSEEPSASPFHKRRKLTLAPGFAYRADGLMTGATVNGQTYGATYGDQGLLTGRSNPFRSVLVSGRDDLGRIIDLRTTAGGVQVLREYTPYVFSGSTLRLPWDGRDKVGQVYSERAGAGAWNEARHFDYDASGRLTYEENEPWPASGVESTGFYYDNGPYATTGGLGVRTARLRDRDLNQLHGVPAVGTYGRVLSEIVRDTPRAVPLSGTALGAATVRLTLDGRDLVPVSFGGWQDAQGLWSATAPMAPGFHLLTATATHPSGWVAPGASSQFQVLPRPETVANTYDEMGNVATRTWRDAQNQILKSQTLTWDARGRLVQVVQTGLNPFTWTALYDGLDRRLRTTYTPAGGAAVTSNSTFDPEVEFLELGLAINGQAAWKVYGPDLSGTYGGLEGLGGLEAVLGADGVTRGIVNDWFGNVAGQVAAPGAPLTWSKAQYLAWGPAPGWSTPPNDGAKPLHKLLGYRGLTLDPTGDYQMGLRAYNPSVGRWLSPDSLGHAASLSLYDYCDNDPLNRFDPDGRFAKGAGTAAKDIIAGTATLAYNVGGGIGYRLLGSGQLANDIYGDQWAALEATSQGFQELSSNIKEGNFGEVGVALTGGEGQTAAFRTGYGATVAASILYGGAKIPGTFGTVSKVATVAPETTLTIVGDEITLIRTIAPKRGPIQWVDEAHGNPAAAAYEAGASGHVPGKAPRLSATDAEGTVTAKFDGVDGDVLVDRKLSVTTFPKSQQQALRQSAVAAKNGYRVRWEVPSQAEATRARNLIQSLGIKNIDVMVK